MIEKKDFYAVKCNCCGELYEDSEGMYYNDKITVEEYALDNDWREHEGGHVCPACYEIGDDDETVLLMPFIPEPEIKQKSVRLHRVYRSNRTYSGTDARTTAKTNRNP